jgi:glycosyltransferase involved in cell wall biosynthesis
MTRADGVSVVVPVLNGRRWLRPVIAGVLAQQDGRPFEIIVVDDGSSDGSLRLLSEWQASGIITLLRGGGHGAAAAINAGIREARHPLIAQVDQDVVLRPGWLSTLAAALDDPGVAAAQGHYVTATDAGFWARSMGRDLEHRYAGITRRHVDHVCTGNTVYRASALHQAGFLDETMGYGYDNDLSYRLARHGFKLAFCPEATSVHRWKEGLRGYVAQQFGVGYGRIDVLARHPGRVAGDDVSGTLMMLHGPAMLAGVTSIVVGTAFSPLVAYAGLAMLGFLSMERLVAGIAAWRRSGDPAALGFAGTHLVRDLTWAVAILVWAWRRAGGLAGRPAHSMWRPDAGAAAGRADTELVRGSVLAIVPAFNEADNLSRVVDDLRRGVPGCDILIVNDGSTDDTPSLLPDLGVAWLTLSQRVGVGGAVRAGIRYAANGEYDYVVRVDGDGQHRACDIPRLLEPVLNGRVDAAIGSRFLGRPARRGMRRLSQAVLARCLSLLTGRRVTDPTSGFWLFGPKAVRLLARHHPTGYAEPELALLLSRNGLRVTEVPIRMRPRYRGRTSLTMSRAGLALARTLLAIVVVPLRRTVEGRTGD